MTAAHRFVLIGHPVGHSVSPAIHGAAYRAHGIDADYRCVDCPDVAAVEAQVEALRRGDIAGANVTIPHKRTALKLADEVDESARAIGAANVLSRAADGRVWAYNTDAPALAERLRLGATSAPKSALVIGSGGAALAAVVACRLAGATCVWVSSRKWDGAPTSGWPKAEEFSCLDAHPVRWAPQELPTDDGPTTRSVAPGCQLIVQASSAGMQGVLDGESVARVVPWAALAPGTFCYDAVYNPPMTPFLAAAEARALPSEGGLSMLVGQAALAIERWLGIVPDRSPMMLSAKQAIFGHKEPNA